MSSNPEKTDRKPLRMRASDQLKRMSSITRRLHWYGIRKRSFLFLRIDLFFFLLLCLGWCADREYAKTGRLVWENARSFKFSENTRHLMYTVTSPEGKVLLRADALKPLIVISIAVFSLFALQMLGQLFSYFREDKKIRKILSPINEIALKADELSRLSFSEDKYQEIEKALENIDPGQAAAEVPLSFNDQDLSGVEAAMNYLLLLKWYR